MTMANTQAINLTGVRDRQPKAFYLCFFVELWERFGYYGMQAILVLYTTKALGFSDGNSYELFGASSALIWIAPLIGGYLGDQLIGYRRALIMGLFLLVVGYGLLALGASHFLYPALAFIIVGSGFFKACPSSLLGKAYGPNDPRLEGGFTLFYMSINIGSLASMSIIGYLIDFAGWGPAYALCAMGLILAIVTFYTFQRSLNNIGSPADLRPLDKRLIPILIIGTAVALVLSTWLLKHLLVTQVLLSLTAVALAGFYSVLLFRLDQVERNKLLACLILIVFAITFFVLYFQAPMSVNLFTDRNVDHHLFGFFVPTATFQSLNPFWIIVLAPVLAMGYTYLSQRQVNPSIPMKFAIGIIVMGVGFLILTLSAAFADKNGIVSAWWMVWSYFLQCVAELLVSAIGLAMVARLAPQRLLGLMMGTWFMGTAIAAMISGQVAKFANVPETQMAATKSLVIYGHAFLEYGLVSVIVGVIALFAVPSINRLMATQEAVK